MIHSETSPGRMQTTHLIFRCFGLHVSNELYFKEIGRISNFYAYATSSTIKNEKRTVHVLQSAPFHSNYGAGRPPTYIYDKLLESEVFEDMQDISPTLIADVKCPENMDCKIQVKVFYSSTRTSGKEVLLGYVNFSLLEFLRVSSENKAFTLIMQSDYCQAAKVNVELFIPFPKVLKSEVFAVHAPKNPKNPLVQKYLLYPEYDNLSAKIDVLEQSWEPRLAFTIPLLYLDNIISAITKSIVAWKQRQNLERMRQGFFKNTKEANDRDWHELSVTVHSANFVLNDSSVAERTKTNTTLMTLVSYPDDESVDQYIQIESENETLPDHFIPNASIENTKKALTNFASKHVSEKPRKFDETLPSTYVDIYVVDSTQTYQLPIGKTNTERFTLQPMYGSNVNASSSKKNAAMVAASEDVKLISVPRTYAFAWTESPNNTEPVDSSRSKFTSDGRETGNVAPRGSKSNPALAADMESTQDVSKLLTVKGEEVAFLKYIPHRSHTSVEFAVYITDSSGKKDILGVCTMPLTTIDEKTVALPIAFKPEYQGAFSSANLRVTVRLTSPDSSIEPEEFVAASEFNEIFNYSREDSGAIRRLDEAGAPEDLFEDYRHVIPDCYSWLWHIGAYHSDPLAVFDKSAVNSEEWEKIVSPPNSSSTSAITLGELLLSEDFGLAEISDRTSPSNARKIGTSRRRRSSERKTTIPTVKRVDFPLNLDWISGYIKQLETLADELIDMRRYVASQQTPSVNSSFRPSVQKKDADVQSLPINLHYQLLACRNHQSTDDPLEVEANVTCGSFSPHGLGHKKGGLYQQENDLLQLRKNIDELKSEYLLQVKKSGSLAISRSDFPFELLQELGRRYCKYETAALSVHHRRILALSQALSTAVNSFHLKIGLVTEGYLSAAAAEQWLEHGMLILFQGLLSVIANEKSMLEDTMSAIDALNLFSVRLCIGSEIRNDENDEKHDYEEISTQRVSFGLESPQTDDALYDNLSKIRSDIEEIEPDFNYLERLSNYAPVSSSQQNDVEPSHEIGRLTRRISAAVNQTSRQIRDADDIVADNTSVVFHGRVITIYIPPQSASKLPASYQHAMSQDSGAKIGFKAILFTQGIDLQQTVATTFANESSGGLGLQADINSRGLYLLNRYCHLIQPINISSSFNGRNESSNSFSGSKDDDTSSRTYSSVMTLIDESHIHPLLLGTYNAITNYRNNVKNVHMLAELERVSQYLRGCKITFCKSGKDRTGMVITYEQARYLNERYGLGYNFDGVIRLANIMRIHGTRLLVAEKNIGKKVFSINKLQAQFFPAIYRPPVQVCEDLLKKDMS